MQGVFCSIHLSPIPCILIFSKMQYFYLKQTKKVDKALKKERKKHHPSKFYTEIPNVDTLQMGISVGHLQHVRQNALVTTQLEVALK